MNPLTLSTISGLSLAASIFRVLRSYPMLCCTLVILSKVREIRQYLPTAEALTLVGVAL